MTIHEGNLLTPQDHGMRFFIQDLSRFRFADFLFSTAVVDVVREKTEDGSAGEEKVAFTTQWGATQAKSEEIHCMRAYHGHKDQVTTRLASHLSFLSFLFSPLAICPHSEPARFYLFSNHQSFVCACACVRVRLHSPAQVLVGRAGGRVEAINVSTGVKVGSVVDAKAPTKLGDKWVGVETAAWAPNRAVGWYTTGRGVVCSFGDDENDVDSKTVVHNGSVVKEFALTTAPIGAFRLHPTAPQAGTPARLYALSQPTTQESQRTRTTAHAHAQPHMDSSRWQGCGSSVGRGGERQAGVDGQERA